MTFRSKVSIFSACGLAAAVGPLNLLGPHTDVAAVVLIWAGLLCALAHERDLGLTKKDAFKIASSILRGIKYVLLGMGAATTAVALTGIGLVPAMVFNSGLNATLTYVFGMTAAHLLSQKDIDLQGRDFAEAMVIAIAAFLGLNAKGFWPEDNA